jgi:hypothetical protein
VAAQPNQRLLLTVRRGRSLRGDIGLAIRWASGSHTVTHARHRVGVRPLLAALTVVSWTYLFIIPAAFSFAIAVCLTAAAWISTNPVSR